MFSGAMGLLQESSGLKLAVAALYDGDALERFECDGIDYYLIPGKKSRKIYDEDIEAEWKAVAENFLPDVVHIHGTERAHGLAFLRALGREKVVVSIQGLVSVYERYYFGSIEASELKRHVTPRDILRKDTLFDQRRNMRARGVLEKESLMLAKHVIGRTSWDRSHALAINSDSRYYHCDETIRSKFYENTWGLDKCQRDSIFLSQAHYPIKGLHKLIMAMPFVLKRFPGVKVRIGGSNLLDKPFWKRGGYANYIISLIKKKGLDNIITFTGPLSEEDMVGEYINSHVFVCPSAIENSPNSIGEAQILGVPCIASYVGGVPDMIEDGVTGLLYRFEEHEMLADSICRLLADDGLASLLSERGRAEGRARHDRRSNSRRLLEIYGEVAKC